MLTSPISWIGEVELLYLEPLKVRPRTICPWPYNIISEVIEQMLYVEKNGTIRLTRGDTAYLTVPIMNKVTGEAYEM